MLTLNLKPSGYLQKLNFHQPFTIWLLFVTTLYYNHNIYYFLGLNLLAYTIPSNPNCPDQFLHFIQLAKKTILCPVLDISVFLFSCLPHSLLYLLIYPSAAAYHSLLSLSHCLITYKFMIA